MEREGNHSQCHISIRRDDVIYRSPGLSGRKREEKSKNGDVRFPVEISRVTVAVVDRVALLHNQ